MGRRSDNPLTILIMGIILLAGFGVSLVLLTNKTPVLRLKPLLEKEFGVPVRTRFRAGSPTQQAAIELNLTDDQALPSARDEELAEWSFARYFELVKETEVGQTSIRRIEVLIVGGSEPRFVLTREQYENKIEAKKNVAGLPPFVEKLGFKDVEIKVLGYSKTGARLGVTCASNDRGRRRQTAAHRAVRMLHGLRYVGSIEFEVTGPEPLKVVGGRDTPLRSPINPNGRRPRRRGRRASQKPATPAPVHSEGR
jgi:hypothetical protein